ncbi:MAG: nicotinamidase [Solirubrobacterales bacterium]|nr:nicotinamidase [Solirubrobacterales bacterium]
MATALLIIDVQNDFTPGGALGVPEGDEVIDRINELAASYAFDVVVATRDWHPPDHGSFDERGGPWPVHCVQGTHGAELHAGLDRSHVDAVVDKGQDPQTEGYSGFEGTELGQLLREEHVTAVTVVGLATDYCVKNTALDAVKEGLLVTVDMAAARGVAPDTTAAAIEELQAAGVIVREGE